jgi:hypothetical protein
MFSSCPHSKWSKTFLLFAFLLVTLFQLPIPSDAAAPKFEVPSNVRASDILPPELISGANYRVRSTVVSYGYMHTYTVDSDFGVFEVTGDFALRKLIREIRAIAQLREVKKSQAYMDGIKKAASQPLEFGANMLTDPVDTVSGVPKGIARLFGNVKTGLTTKDSTGEDSKVEQALAVSSNKRALASRLGVDVYSSNSVLQKDLNSLAWATSLGSLTVSAALAPVGGPAVAAVSITKTAQQVSDVLKDYPPQRLREMNEQKLLAMGVPSSLTAQFLDHPSYTPTHDTVIAHSLEALSGAQGRAAFIQQALSADDEETANFFMYIAETMRGYAQKGSPIREISVYGPLVFAKAANGAVLIPLPLDYGIWTERASQRVPMAVSAFKAANPDVKKYDVWVTGTVSKLAKEGMGKLGLQVVEKVDKQVGYVY